MALFFPVINKFEKTACPVIGSIGWVTGLVRHELSTLTIMDSFCIMLPFAMSWNSSNAAMDMLTRLSFKWIDCGQEEMKSRYKGSAMIEFNWMMCNVYSYTWQLLFHCCKSCHQAPWHMCIQDRNPNSRMDPALLSMQWSIPPNQHDFNFIRTL